MDLIGIRGYLEELLLNIKKNKALRVVSKAVDLGEVSENILEKAKYIKRTGSPGNYKYEYAKDLAGKGKKEEVEDIRVKSKSEEITAIELKSLLNYTVSSYSKINAELRLGKVSQDVSEQVKNINNALNKLPMFKEYVYRGMSLSSSGGIDKFLEEWGKGNIIVMDAFTSSSQIEGIAMGFGDFQIKIKSKNGVSIAFASTVEYEKEVLFKAGAKFKVESIKIVREKPLFEEEEHRVVSVSVVLEEV